MLFLILWLIWLIIFWNLFIFFVLEPGVWQGIGFFYGNGFILFRWIYPALKKIFKEKQKEYKKHEEKHEEKQKLTYPFQPL